MKGPRTPSALEKLRSWCSSADFQVQPARNVTRRANHPIHKVSKNVTQRRLPSQAVATLTKSRYGFILGNPLCKDFAAMRHSRLWWIAGAWSLGLKSAERA